MGTQFVKTDTTVQNHGKGLSNKGIFLVDLLGDNSTRLLRMVIPTLKQNIRKVWTYHQSNLCDREPENVDPITGPEKRKESADALRKIMQQKHLRNHHTSLCNCINPSLCCI